MVLFCLLHMKWGINMTHIILSMVQPDLATEIVVLSTAWEPGSGCTIMSYAGLCGAENLAGGKIPFYHVGSYDLMNSYVSFASL